MMDVRERRARWRLVLGESDGFREPPELGEQYTGVDNTLSAVYGPAGKDAEARRGAGKTGGGFGLLNRLAQLRGVFSGDAIALMQRDIVERTELRRLLSSPRALAALKPDSRTASALLAYRNLIPESSREAAREYVRGIAETMRNKLEPDIRRAVSGAHARRERAAGGTGAVVDVKRTVEKNLRNYHGKSGKIIPEKLYFFRKRQAVRDLDVILALDQSASMSDSMLYASVMGGVLCSIPALDTRVIAFDHRVADISEACREDSVGALFGLQLGGGTDIAGAVDYCSGLVSRPDRTLFILLTDLFDRDGGGATEAILRLRESGVTVLMLLALSDRGRPAHDAEAASTLAQSGIACVSCGPEAFAGVLETALSRMNIPRA